MFDVPSQLTHYFVCLNPNMSRIEYSQVAKTFHNDNGATTEPADPDNDERQASTHPTKAVRENRKDQDGVTCTGRCRGADISAGLRLRLL